MEHTKLAKMGGDATKKKYGREHYQRIGRIGGSKLKNKDKWLNKMKTSSKTMKMTMKSAKSAEGKA